MASKTALRRSSPLSAGAVALLILAGCNEPGQGFDWDLRGNIANAFDTSDAVARRVDSRPTPDRRGVISYPNYQVAVANRGDTVATIAGRVGLPADEIARYNGLPATVALRQGEVVALPRRVTEPSSATGTVMAGPTRSAQTITSTPLETPAAQPVPQRTAAAPQTGAEPVRHKVGRGETAFTIARLYDVPAQALAEWNGLGPDMAVREGQYLLIPVASPAPVRETPPGAGSVAPVPPSAAKPLPERDEVAGAPPKDTPPSPDLGKQQTAQSEGKFVFPVAGPIIRPYSKGKNDGIDISAPAGSAVKAADGGTVAAITRDTDQVPILVLRHPGNILTVYAGVDDIEVNKGDSVRRGQTIARIRDTATPSLHFEVREGFESVDPVGYLE
ncbi:LysM domain/M23/M37 peptidase [Oceaniovalibus guishaninsula JLT2003]|uniref:LysM domain/M23/M37 peptidase n=1 Tax=Oceaniovalibus guishaninsula JLT2003 TaxID=1231392 RepID=K2HF28_9RHOB|nr:LysM peptidoglycan-binding domain-containing M23 family metallopeptidase [Oceaniovalibus guishaninsula]EKE45092.1 LysM domain/M23/M37 peptidase [Oceaniovalibus guishaninsula JLT2003]